MRTLTETQARGAIGGGFKCRVCGAKITGFWRQYAHCLKHSWNAVMPIAEFIALFFI